MNETKDKILGLFRSASRTQADQQTPSRRASSAEGSRPRRSRQHLDVDGNHQIQRHRSARHHRSSRNEREGSESDSQSRQRHSSRRDRRSRSAEGNAGKQDKLRRQHSARRKSREPVSKSPSREKPRTRAPSVFIPALSPVWPPAGFNEKDVITREQAVKLITPGVPIYRGFRRSIPHASDEYFALYAACEGPPENEGDGAGFHDPQFAVMTLQLHGSALPSRPWDSLEQPSLAFFYGNRPGTITLNQWASSAGNLKPTIELRDSGVKPRDVSIETIFDRLKYLEGGFEENDPDLMYKNLYKKILKDPGGILSKHTDISQQIADLIVVLSAHNWIDFSESRNQVVTKYFANVGHPDSRRYFSFFHQLLLSIELDKRIHSKQHADVPKKKLLAQLPPKIAWDLALARKWCECMNIESSRAGTPSKQVEFHLRMKRQQIKALRKFARAMKWPSVLEIESVLKSRQADGLPLEERSSDAMAFFSGVILPGPSFKYLLMNSLIDIDKDAKDLDCLTHMWDNCGFQYRSTTYWSSGCIVGKVLAPTCHEVAGWVGPARPAPDLESVQIARIRQRRPRQGINTGEVTSMALRSDPLGPPAESYPIDEYQLVLPDRENFVDSIRIERLVLTDVGKTDNVPLRSSSGPTVFDASIYFAVGGRSWPLRLLFSVSFICACPCTGGPHPLFYDYIYRAVAVDELLTTEDWGNLNGGTSTRDNKKPDQEADDSVTNDIERVLVVEAFGVPDNEVLARAYCAHWGLSAIVANVRKTCLACAIREAYAACLNLVILVEDLQYDPDV